MKLQRKTPLFSAIAGEPQFAGREWFRTHVDAADPDTAHIYFQDEIGFFGTTPSAVVAQLNAIKAPRITMHINSPGGSVFDGFAIYNALRAHPAEKTAVVEGLSASIATVIMLGANKVRFAKNAQMMIHNPACVVFGDSSYLRNQAAVLDDLRDSIVEIYREKTGKTRGAHQGDGRRDVVDREGSQGLWLRGRGVGRRRHPEEHVRHVGVQERPGPRGGAGRPAALPVPHPA
ncbi:MAG: Clp protease ClpP [Opitutaceae bacterium]|nr:Clp protease ClpP [Opitutaceae bacterium]